MEVGGIFYRLAGKDKPAVLRSVVEVLRLPDKVDREFLLQVLLAREALESTAIGDGIAIPHVRNPIVLHVPQPVVTLCFLEAPVDFGALDGQPVQTLVHAHQPHCQSASPFAVTPGVRLAQSRFQVAHHTTGEPR